MSGMLVLLISLCLISSGALSDPVVRIDDKSLNRNPAVCIEGSCYASLQKALARAEDHDTVTLKPGIYHQAGVLRANGVTVFGDGAHLLGVATEGKAALIIKGDDATIVGLEISNVRVPDGNGAAIRQEGRNLILRNVHFHDNEMGILTGKGTGMLLIEDSLFENNGYRGSALGHNVYAQGQTLKFIRSQSLRARNEGHEIKSRALRTFIDQSVIASIDSRDSRSIDIPNGGDIIITNSILQKGLNSSNSDMIGVALENVSMHPPMTASIEDNVIIFDTSRNGKVVRQNHMNAVKIKKNTIVSSWKPDLPGNAWFPTRAKARFPDYPDLPRSSGD